MQNETRVIELHGLVVPNDRAKTVRRLALKLDEFQMNRGDIVFALGMRGAGKSAFHDAIQAIFGSGRNVGENLTIRQADPKKPSIEVARLWRADSFCYHSQSGKPEHVPEADEDGLAYCDDPNDGGPTGPAIIDLVIERKHTMVIGTDPDRLELTLRHFLERNVGRILWLHKGEKLFEGSGAEFCHAKRSLCDALPRAENSSDEKFLAVVRRI